MNIWLANGLCIVLVAVDYIARTWRMQCLAAALHTRTRFVDVVTLNAVSDAASAVTPLRAGGEPVRFFGLVHAGLSASNAIAVMAVEGIIEWLIVAAIGLGVGLRFGPEWWRSVSRTLVPHLHHALPWAIAFSVVGVLIWLAAQRLLPKLTIHVGTTLKESLRLAVRMPVWAILVTVVFTAVHIVARLAILPVVMATADVPPDFGPVIVGSIALLYGQSFVPTPSGMGAVELGFLGGAAGGYTGSDSAALLLLWRFYTTLTGIALGFVCGLPLYGTALHRSVLRRRAERRNIAS
ncbi:MAG TPA: lysylphosphatidylglycerol synthase transmembrane domain-containing protein [Gemmatimonadaceae bacterium]|jgi:uncharacterized membrane protein YbhN (UPF0104 family)|nr:lysylphosphatidylglycerol synthase transmembrane domain-containing protein [Gemmatimonadaceae bacterium]